MNNSPKLGMKLYIYYLICSDLCMFISINTKHKCWWLVRFEDVYKFIRGHRVSLEGSPRSPPFYFPIFIEPNELFSDKSITDILEYLEHFSIFHFPFCSEPVSFFPGRKYSYIIIIISISIFFDIQSLQDI